MVNTIKSEKNQESQKGTISELFTDFGEAIKVIRETCTLIDFLLSPREYMETLRQLYTEYPELKKSHRLKKP